MKSLGMRSEYFNSIRNSSDQMLWLKKKSSTNKSINKTMNSRNKIIALVDQHIEKNSKLMSDLNRQNHEIVILDPIQMFTEIDWTQFEEDVRVINKIYSRLFEEVVIFNKQLVCFWPLSEQFGSDWIELASLCKANSYELEIYKSLNLNNDDFGFSEEILRAWKKFVYFLIESLLDDIQLNEDFEEIATLTSDRNCIILFKIEQEGKVRYSFAFDTEQMVLGSNLNMESQRNEYFQPSFESFREMLVKLLGENDLSLYQTRFSDPQLEKTYFNVLAKEFKNTNLIETWIKSYSLN
ncbi:MAG TPA: hypothetical protein VLA71_02965 [Algoriphagus sp.]|nr:hypothetical protein [Algoriphagus sp.]